MPILLHRNTFIPVFDATIYSITNLRPKSGSPATIEQALRGVQLVLTFVDSREIDLPSRFRSGEFLALHELDDLVRVAHRKMDLMDAPHDDSNATVCALKRDTSKKRGRPDVAFGTAGIRLHYALRYLQWFGNRAGNLNCTTLEQRRDYKDMLRTFLDHLRVRMPQRITVTNREGLEPAQKTELLRVIDIACPDNPWDDEFVRNRNRLLILWGLTTGLRRGELLGMRIKLIDLRRNTVDIIRRPDDKNDPRKNQPNTKTRGRSIGISDELASLTHDHIVKFRSNIRAARKHDFLFVSNKGEPLSLSGMSKTFRVLRARHPLVGASLTSHVLRHEWNEEFSDAADSAGMSPEDERRARNHSMGWSDFSNSAEHYLRRRTQRLAAEASEKIQKSVVNLNKNRTNGK